MGRIDYKKANTGRGTQMYYERIEITITGANNYTHPVSLEVDPTGYWIEPTNYNFLTGDGCYVTSVDASNINISFRVPPIAASGTKVTFRLYYY